MAWGAKSGRTFKPFVEIEDSDVQLRGVIKKGSYWYMKVAKKGSWITTEHLLGSPEGKGPKSGRVLGAKYWVEWEAD